LNDLADTPHNAAFKCFASRQRERMAAFETLHSKENISLSERFWMIVNELWHVWFLQGGEAMSSAVTPEYVEEMGKKLFMRYLRTLPVERRLEGLTPEEVLRLFEPEDRLKGLRPEDRLKGLKPEDRLKGLRPEDRLKGLRPEDRLKGLKPEDIEAYLRQITQQASDT